MVQGQTFAEVVCIIYMLVQTSQKDTSLKNGRKYHTIQTHTTSTTTKNMLVQLRFSHSMKRMKELMVFVLKRRFQKLLMRYHFGHASNNTLNKVNVSFAYRYWRNIATEPQKANLDLHFKIY